MKRNHRQQCPLKLSLGDASIENKALTGLVAVIMLVPVSLSWALMMVLFAG